MANSSSYATNKTPITVRAEQMVRRGEARDYSEACSLLAKRRTRKPRTPYVSTVNPQAIRLPYID